MITKIISTILLVLFTALILAFSVRGNQGNPTADALNTEKWKDKGPLELSPERGRFGLTYSIAEDNSFFFSLPLARFVVPDLGYRDGNYVSLFAPGLSFLVIPGYLLGKTFGIAQVGAFSVVALFALLNVILVRAIAIRLGAHSLAATIAALAFLFATPAFAYAVTLYQHHMSTFLILLSIYTLLRWNNMWSLSLIWFLCALSIPLDYPNLFLMLPIGILALGKMIFVEEQKDTFRFTFKLSGLPTFFTALLPVFFLLWFNFMSYGDPFQLSGTVSGVRAIDEYGKPAAPDQAQGNIEKYIKPETQNKFALRFFKTRNITRGLTVNLASLDRGILIFTPIMLLGIAGIVYAYKERVRFTALFLAIIGANILLYSMWGDPWGGWAFGSRYLIPSYSIMAIFIALLLSRLRKNILFLLLFFALLTYSIAIGTLGALTSNQNPPKEEVKALNQTYGVPFKYSYDRNWDLLLSNKSKSFVYQTFAKPYTNAFTYYVIVCSLLVCVSAILLTIFYILARREEHHG